MTAFRRKPRAPKRRRIRKLRLLALLCVLGLLGLSAFTYGLLTAIAEQIPELDPARQTSQQANTYIYANDGRTVLAVLRGEQARIIVDSEDISPWLKHATVAIEDKRFWEHRGVDVRGILRAAWADIRHRGTIQGGSTITQQFVKNAIVGDQTTIARKVREATLAWQLEQRWTKDRILTAYLNTIYYGNGAYGVEQASRVYFGHSAAAENVAEATAVAEAALLAAIPADPSRYDPVARPRAAKARRNLVLREMRDQGYLDAKQYRAALAVPLPDPREIRRPAVQNQLAPYFASYVTDQLVDRFGARNVFGGGKRVQTTIDLRLQRLAREAIAEVLPPEIGPTAALVTLDARTGAVLAMVGGRNFRRSQFNLATQGERQPGSAFKPIVLAAALRAGIAPTTTFESREVTIDAGGRLWSVSNYDDLYQGVIDLRQATVTSDNAVYAQLTKLIGPQRVVRTAKALGITSPLDPYFSIGLGAEPATPLELARAYTAFANGGARIDGSIVGNAPRAIEWIEDVNGNRRFNEAVPTRVLADWEAGVVNELLQGVVAYGTGRAAQIPGYTVAGKTGTTENYGDAWFVGYTPELVTAIWIGYPDELRPMLTEYGGRPVAGGTYPALLWKEYMTKVLDELDLPPSSFVRPSAPYTTAAAVVLRDARLRRDNGYCRETRSVQLFADSPLPLADCKPNEVEVPDVRGATVAAARERLAGQPLEASVAGVPARPGQRVGIVVRQIPPGGTLSAHDRVTLVVRRPTHGVVPRVVGLDAEAALARLARLDADVELRGGDSGRVVAQWPRPGVAAGPEMRVVLTVRDAGTAG